MTKIRELRNPEKERLISLHNEGLGYKKIKEKMFLMFLQLEMWKENRMLLELWKINQEVEEQK